MPAWRIALILAVAATHACSKPDKDSRRDAPAGRVVTPVVASTVLDPVVAYLPPDAFAVAAFDLDQTRRSPATTRIVERLLARTAQRADVETAAHAGGLDLGASGRALLIAGVPAAVPGEPPQVLIVVGGPLDEAQAERQLVAEGGTVAIRDADRVTIALHGVSVLIRQDLLVIAPAAVLERSIAAHAGDSAAEAGELRDAVLAARGGTAGFVAVRMIDDLRRGARDLAPDLATASWFAGSFNVAGGVKLIGIGAFPDRATAVRVAGAVQLGKSFGLSELRTTDPTAAWAVEKIIAMSVGTTLRVTATLTDTELLALLALVR